MTTEATARETKGKRTDMGMFENKLLDSDYYDVDLYPGSEDWMEMQMDITRRVQGDPGYVRFGVGMIELAPTGSADEFEVIIWDDKHDASKSYGVIREDRSTPLYDNGDPSNEAHTEGFLVALCDIVCKDCEDEPWARW